VNTVAAGAPRDASTRTATPPGLDVPAPRPRTAESRKPSTVRLVVSTAALAAALFSAVTCWALVVERFREAAPVEAHGAPNAIVWSGRVFATEAALSTWLRARGISYERWVRTHPAAVAILRERDAPGGAPPPKPDRTAPSRSSP
jgi:hypothetical protein